jgi:hypothetical protein
MQLNAQSILSVTLILVALFIILRDAQGTNSIIRGLAEGYADVVKALQGNR